MEETQTELDKEVGTIEPERKTLKPAIVKIVKVDVQEVGNDRNKKVVCQVEHPDAEVPIAISSVAFLKDKAVKNSGLWYNLDKEENIQKGSALASFIVFTNVKTLKELEGLNVQTELDGNFLCFKAY